MQDITITPAAEEKAIASAPAPTPKKVASVVAKPVAKTPRVKPAATKPAATKPVAKKPLTKAAPKSVAKPATKPAPKAADPVEKKKKPKMVRDSFTIPKAEYAVLADLKERAVALKISAKKTELVRAGIKALAGMSDTAFAAAVKGVPNLKTGRPSKA